jgi:uncharacterized protein (TIGR01244 family)
MILNMIAIVTLALASISGETAALESSESIVKADLSGIVNFTRISGSSGFAGSPVGFGGTTDPSAMAALKDQGFSTVVNLRLATEDGVDVEASQQAATAAGLKYIHFPFNSSEPGATDVDDFLKLIGDQSNQPVYIHCGSATRAAALWMIGRVLEDGWSLERAGAEARQVAGKPEAAIQFATKYLDSQ